MLGPQGKLLVKELCLGQNLEGRPGPQPGRRKEWASQAWDQQQQSRPAHSTVWAVEEGTACSTLCHAKKLYSKAIGSHV